VVKLDERQLLIDRLAAAPGRVRAAAEAAQRKIVPPGEWPPHVVVGHLAHVEGDVWQARLAQMQAEDNPFWEYWEPDGIDWQGLYGARPLVSLLADFDRARGATVARLEALAEADWERHGTHRRWGEVDVARLCEEILKHDENHIGQIALP
jgi:hypothetical protein